MILPTILEKEEFTDPVVKPMLKGINYFAPPLPNFRGSITTGTTRPQPSEFSKRMLRLTGSLCEFIDNDFRYGTTFSHSFAGDYNSVLLLRHCVSNRVNASSAMCKETIPDLLYNVIWNREIRPDTGSIIGQKGFLDFMRIAIYMMLYCPQETVKRLTPCLETLFNWTAGMFSMGYIEMPGFHCQCIAMLCDLVTLMAKSDPAILQLLCDEGPMDAAEIL